MRHQFKFLTVGGFISSGTLVPNWNITPLTNSPVPARIKLISCQEITEQSGLELWICSCTSSSQRRRNGLSTRLVCEPVITREMEYVCNYVTTYGEIFPRIRCQSCLAVSPQNGPRDCVGADAADVGEQSPARIANEVKSITSRSVNEKP